MDERETPRTKVAGRDDVATRVSGDDENPTLLLGHAAGPSEDTAATVVLRHAASPPEDAAATVILGHAASPPEGTAATAVLGESRERARSGRAGECETETFYRLPTALADRYEIIEEIGSGGQGVVLRCHDHVDGIDVAIKLLNRGVAGRGAEFITQLRDCDPDHVTPIYDADERGRWEVQEFFEGGTLDRVPRSYWNGETVTEFVRQMHAALSHVHGRQILHQDLKPANIFVRSLTPFDIVLGDFGLGRQQEVTEQVSSTDGTLAYQSPEYALAGRHSAGGDWWALGMIIHILLVGRHVYAGDDGRIDGRAVRAHLFDGAINLDAITDPRWRLLVEGLLTAELRDRWGSNEVGRWLQGELPEVRRRESPSVKAARTRNITLLQRVCSTPEQVAAVLGNDTGAALDYLRSGASDELVDWLRRVGLAGEAGEFIAPIRKGRPGAERNLIALQALLDPESSPRFAGYELSVRAMLEVADAAADGDEEAGTWIKRMRTSRVLTGAAQLETHAAMAMTDERLRMWWGDLETRLSGLPTAVQQLAQGQRPAFEGLALAAALSDSRLAEVVKSGSTQVRRASHVGDDLLRAVAPRGNDDVVAALLGLLVVPEVERRGKAEAAEQERRQARAASLMKEAEKQRKQLQRKTTREQHRGEHKARFLRRVWLHGSAALLAIVVVGSFGPSGLADAAALIGIGLAVVLTILTLVDLLTGQARRRLPRLLGLPAAAATTMLAVASSSLSTNSLTPAFALAPPAGWIVGYTLGSAVGRLSELLRAPRKWPKLRLGSWAGLLPALVAMGWAVREAGWMDRFFALLPDTVVETVRTVEQWTAPLDLPGPAWLWIIPPVTISIIWLFDPALWGRFGVARRWLGLITVALSMFVALDQPSLLVAGLAGVPALALLLLVMTAWVPKPQPPVTPHPQWEPSPLGPPPYA